MPTRAERRRNREAREAVAEREAFIRRLPDLAEEKLGIRSEFVAEAIRSSGLVSLTMRPRGAANHFEVRGGAISIDKDSGLSGDTVVNNWELPDVKGFRVRFDKDSALVARLAPTFTSLDVSDVWLRTSDELLVPQLSVAEEGGEEHITVTRDGLTLLAQTIGHGAISEGLRYIEGQIFSKSS